MTEAVLITKISVGDLVRTREGVAQVATIVPLKSGTIRIYYYGRQGAPVDYKTVDSLHLIKS